MRITELLEESVCIKTPNYKIAITYQNDCDRKVFYEM